MHIITVQSRALSLDVHAGCGHAPRKELPCHGGICRYNTCGVARMHADSGHEINAKMDPHARIAVSENVRPAFYYGCCRIIMIF